MEEEIKENPEVVLKRKIDNKEELTDEDVNLLLNRCMLPDYTLSTEINATDTKNRFICLLDKEFYEVNAIMQDKVLLSIDAPVKVTRIKVPVTTYVYEFIKA